MKKLWFICCLGVVLGSCDADNEIKNMDEHQQASTSLAEDPSQEEVLSIWVCHHPGTEFHNTGCIEEQYPDGCYVAGDHHKFCWILKRKDCLRGYENEPYEACKLFEDLSTEFSEKH